MISKKLATAVGAGAIAGAVGISIAGGAFTASAAPATASTATATHTKTANAKTANAKGAHKGHKLGELGRVLHGQGVVKTKTGFETIAVDRGTVTAVTPTSVTITSADKVATTFTATSTSKIRLDGKTSTMSAAKVGDKAGTVAVVSGSTNDMKVLILRDSAAKTHTKTTKTSGATA